MMRSLKANPIPELRRILRDQYDFRSILKELIQNADDAGAKHFHLGWMDNWPTGLHSLLCSPAIVVLNDGEFTSTNAEAICCIDVGSKGSDLHSIGKFGLGMKSVFHLCESFFFLASSNQPAAVKDGFKGELLNPWSDMHIHDEWGKNLEPTCRFLNQRIEAWNNGCDRWFCLVIPLRIKRQLGGKAPIVAEYPNIRDFFEPNILKTIKSLTPLLHSLDSVTIWSWKSKDFHRFKALKMPSSNRRQFPTMKPGDTNPIRGRVFVEKDEVEKAVMEFAGRECFLSDLYFSELQKKEQWPTSGTLDSETGEYKDKPEQAAPHCAVVFSVLPKDKKLNHGRLRIRQAFFLPLAKMLSDSNCKGNLDFQLLLHGYFFLDAGRKEVVSNGGDQRRLEDQWNENLKVRGIYPQVLPALDYFVQMSSLKSQQIRDLTRSICNTDFYRDNIHQLCDQKKWFYSLSRNGNDKKRWRLVKSDTPLLMMPAPPDDSPDLPFEVFPALSSLCEKYPVSYEGYPYLSSEYPDLWHDRDNALEELLDSVDPETFLDRQRISYFLQFLENERTLPDESSKRLMGKIKEVSAAYGLEKLHKSSDEIRKIVKWIDQDRKVFLSIDGLGKHPYEIFDQLLSLRLDYLVLPNIFKTENDRGGKLSIENSMVLFDYLTRSDLSQEIKSTLAYMIVEKTQGELSRKKRKLGTYNLFLCEGYEDKKRRLLCWNDLDNLLNDRQLFARGSQFAPSLQKALMDIKFFRLLELAEIDPFPILFQNDNAPRLDKRICYEILKKTPRLREAEHRKDALDRLQGMPSDYPEDEYLKAMRYLLHGEAEKCKDVKTFLLREPQVEHADLLNKLARSAMGKLDQQWRWLDKKLTDTLSHQRAEELNIRHVDFHAVEKLLQDAVQKEGIDWLLNLDLSGEEKKKLLTKIQNEDLWRRLPLHETIDGRFCHIVDESEIAAFYEDEYPLAVPKGFENKVRVVKKTAASALTRKYKEYLRVWNVEAVLNILCDCQTPVRYWLEILDTLQIFQDRKKELDPETTETLKKTRWLPFSKSSVAPEDMVHIPLLKKEIARLLSDPQLKGEFCSVELIDDAAKGHKAFPFVEEKLFPSQNEALESFGLCLSEIEKYHIGRLSHLHDNPSDWYCLVAAFEGAPPDLLPVIGILRALREVADDLPHDFVTNLAKPIPIEKIHCCLGFLTRNHIQADAADKKAIRTVFNWYLESLRASEDFELDEIKKLELLNRRGQWASPELLSLESQGIDDSNLLDADQAKILKDVVPTEPDKEFAGEETSEREIDVREYFLELEQHVPHPALGGFLSLLGDSEKIRRMAKEYLEPRSIKGFRNIIEWDPLKNPHNMVGTNETIHDAMEKQRFRIRFHSREKEHPVLNLTGNLFYAKISDTYKNIFIGNFETCRMENYRCYKITFRNIDPSSLGRNELIDLFLDSARILMRKAYCREPANLEELWDDLSRTDQLSLEIVQHQILENAFLNFKQLGLASLPKVSKIIKKWNRIRRRQVEIEHSVSKGQPIDESIKNDIREIKETLRKAIETDPEIRRESLEAVRSKMETQFQYRKTSILFELFQNSDDAAVELCEMTDPALPPPLCDRVKIGWDEKKIVWTHWGRRINEFRRGKFTSDMGRDLGYDADIENMLFLHSSDKESRREKVTGKYGLGFKSVFLLTDNPKIVSGDLGFEVIGGFYPKYLHPDEKDRLTNHLVMHDGKQAKKDATVIELKAKENDTEEISDMVTAFESLIPLLLVFSRHIKKCTSQKPGAVQQRLEWHENQVPGCRNVFHGKIGLSIENEPFSELAMLRGEDFDALLVKVGANGVEKLPNHIPTFWVTAPTEEKLDLGFAINGPFAIDIGRARLAGDVHRRDELTNRLGRGIGAALCEMFEVSLEDWPQFCDALGMLEKKTSQYRFWDSIWNLLAKGVAGDRKKSHSHAELVRSILWKKGCGMTALLEEYKALPTGLPGDHECLTHYREIRYLARGIIDLHPDIFPEISKWPVFQRVKKGQIVSHSHAGSIMRKLFPDDWKRESLYLKNIVEWNFMDDSAVYPDTAGCLGKILTRSFLDGLEKSSSEIREEGKELREYLKELRFQANDGSFQAAKDLLAIDQTDDEETMRALFAPNNRVLHPDYRDDGIAFFKACRPQMKAQSEILAQWIGQAKSKEKRTRALQYLLKGELRRKVGKILEKDGLPDWIRSMQESIHNAQPSSFLNEIEGDEQLQLFGTLGYSMKDMSPEPASSVETPVAMDSRATLQAIYQWWGKNKKEEIRQYEKRLYVGGDFPDINKDGIDDDKDRMEWLKLFLYGMLHSVGRSKVETNRKFVEICIRREWLAPLAQEKPKLYEWVRNWEKYIDEQTIHIPFFHWMKQLIGLYVIAKSLEDIVDAFLSVNYISTSFSMDQITATRLSEHFQGGGPDAPPITNILGIGSWFVMRELVRKELVENKRAHEHCYVPVSRVRSLVEKLGGPDLENANREDRSKMMYKFIVEKLGQDKADFSKSFDIPLLLISENDTLWSRFLHESRPDMENTEELE